LLAQLVEQVTL